MPDQSPVAIVTGTARGIGATAHAQDATVFVSVTGAVLTAGRTTRAASDHRC